MGGSKEENLSSEAILELLRSPLEEWAGSPPEALIPVSLDRRAFSTVLIFKVLVGGKEHILVAKKVRHAEVNRHITESENQAKVEFEVLKELYGAFEGVKGCAVPEPVVLLPEEELLVVRYVKGELLTDKLRAARFYSGGRAFSELYAAYNLAGRWLRRLQQHTGVRACPSAPFKENIIERLRVRGDEISRSGSPLWGDSETRALLEKVKVWFREVEGDSLPMAGRHGDYGHWNIIVGGGGITVIDFLGYRLEPPLYDPIKVLLGIKALGDNPLVSKKRVKLLGDAFLEGYGLTTDENGVKRSICEAYHRFSIVYGIVTAVGGSRLDRFARVRTLKENAAMLRRMIRGEGAVEGQSLFNPVEWF